MEPKRINSENPVIKYEVKYGDTWYGIAEAKYGSKGYRQTMEIVKALKSLNNINPQDNNMQEELSMMDTITLKNGKTLLLKMLQFSKSYANFLEQMFLHESKCGSVICNFKCK